MYTTTRQQRYLRNSRETTERVFSESLGLKMARPTPLPDTVAKTLNRLTDRVFLEALSASDSDAMTQLIEDYFCGDGGIIAMH